MRNFREKIHKFTLLPRLMTFWLALEALANAQTLQVALERYQRGDVKGAESAAKLALDSKLSRPDRAKVLKILGLVQYLAGNKSASQKSFEQALAHDPQLTVLPHESLDPSALTFFQNIKGRHRRLSPGEPAAHVAGSTPKQQRPIAGTAPAKRTLLKVHSNVAKAQVTIDGILAGVTNELINVDPGKITIEVTASGFLPRKASLTITRDAENTVTMNLEKPKPPTVAVAPSKKPGASLPKKPLSRKPAGKKLPAGEEDLFAPTPSETWDTGNTRNPRQNAQVGSGGSDPARAFEEEAQMASNPQPLGYPQTQVLTIPQQGQLPLPAQTSPQSQLPATGQAGQQPIIITPPPVIYQTPMYQPPAYYPPPANLSQPVGPPPDPYTTGQAVDPGPPDPAHTRDSGQDKGDMSLFSIMPYGIGQLTQKRYLMAGIFAGAGGAAIALYVILGNDISSKSSDFNQVAKQCNGAAKELTDQEKAQCNTYLEQQKKLISEDKSNQTLAMAGAIGIAAISSIEAAIWEPEAKPSGSPKKKKSRSRKYRGFSLYEEKSRDGTLKTSASLNLRPYPLSWRGPYKSLNSWGPELLLETSF